MVQKELTMSYLCAMLISSIAIRTYVQLTDLRRHYAVGTYTGPCLIYCLEVFPNLIYIAFVFNIIKLTDIDIKCITILFLNIFVFKKMLVTLS